MGRTRLVYLLVGFAAGLLLGVLMREPGQPTTDRRSPSQRHDPTDSVAEGMGRVYGGVSGTVDANENARSSQTIDPVKPSAYIPATAEVEDGIGWIEVDFAGYEGEHTAWVEGFDLFGQRKVVEAWGDDKHPIARLEVPPGAYPVWWMDVDGLERIGRRMRVEAGRTTRLRAADPSARPLPLPAGLGRLEVTVAAAEGGMRAGAEVGVRGAMIDGYDSVEGHSNTHGRCRFELRPGRYLVSIGDRKEWVVVHTGQTTKLDLGHRNEGDLFFATVIPSLLLLPLGHQSTGGSPWAGGGNTNLLFVAAGEYEVLARITTYEKDTRRLGNVLIEAGKTTFSDFRVPTGQIRVIIEPGTMGVPPSVELRAMAADTLPQRIRGTASRSFKDKGKVSGKPDVWEAHFVYLSAGEYRVHASAPGWAIAERTVRVTDILAEVEITLTRDTSTPR